MLVIPAPPVIVAPLLLQLFCYLLFFFLLISSLHGLSDFNQLICKRSALPAPGLELSGSHTSLPGYLPSLINLKALQEDVFAIQLAGKPLIGPPQSLRTRFYFRDAKHLAKEKYVTDKITFVCFLYIIITLAYLLLKQMYLQYLTSFLMNSR